MCKEDETRKGNRGGRKKGKKKIKGKNNRGDGVL
jgi:hypothetical protein